MRVVVTGGAGFIGSYVISRLVGMGCEVLVVDNLVSGSQDNLCQGVRLVEADVRQDLTEAFRDFGPSVVVHLAAQTSVSVSMAEPHEDMAVNIQGCASVVESAARARVRKIVAVSSAAVYGHAEYIPINESTPTVPISPYGVSKLAGELYVRILGERLGVASTILRLSNVYGPRQRILGEGAVIPVFIDHLIGSQTPVIHGDGNQIRDFLFVEDAARAITDAMTRADGLVLNVSSGEGVSVNQLWEEMTRLVGNALPVRHGERRAGDIESSVLSHDRARTELNWEPLYSLPKGLERTIAWRRESDPYVSLRLS